MPPISALSTGCLESILSGTDVDKPVVQILGSKKIPGPEGADRLRLLVSDGKHLNSFAMLATQLNGMHAKGELEENTIVRLDRYITSMVNKSDRGDRRVLVILELTVLNSGSEVGRKIGNPLTYAGDSSSGANSNAPKPTANVTPAANRPTNGSAFGNKPAANSYETASSLSRPEHTMLSQGSSMLTHPIASLSPYQNKWVIKARVTGKSPMRSWSNAKGEGKLFSMDLMDESGEIRATAFRDMAEKFYAIIDVDKVYYFSKCQLKPANKAFNTLQNDYEMTFTNETLVQACEDGASMVPQMKLDFVDINKIVDVDPKAAIDVIGVCKETSEIQKFTGRTNNREFTKREIVLIDQSKASITLTLWGDDAENFDGSVHPVVMVKGARVSEFGGGKSLSVGPGSTLKVNPDVQKGHHLRGWFDNTGHNVNIESNLSTRTGAGTFSTEWMTFRDAQLKNLGSGDRPDYFQVKGVIHIVRAANAVYKACPSADCNKKVVDEGNGQYRCEKCNQSFNNFKYRLLINMSIADWTSNRWVTAFNDVAEQLLGKTAEEVGQEMEVHGEQVLQALNFKSFVFKLRAKMETYGDMNRNKLTVMSATNVNYKEYNKYLLKEVEELLGISKLN